MNRKLALSLLACSLGACAAAPMSDIDALLHDVVHDRSTQVKCAGEMYCVSTGSRIAPLKDSVCRCDPPVSLQGRPVAR